MTNTQYNKKIQNFFSEYIIVKNPVAVYENGMMKKETVKEAVELLIEKMFFHLLKI